MAKNHTGVFLGGAAKASPVKIRRTGEFLAQSRGQMKNKI